MFVSGGLLLALTCRMGMANAPVLPEPVCARPMTSLPTGHADAALNADTIFKQSKERSSASTMPTCKQMRNCLFLYAGGRLPS